MKSFKDLELKDSGTTSQKRKLDELSKPPEAKESRIFKRLRQPSLLGLI